MGHRIELARAGRNILPWPLEDGDDVSENGGRGARYAASLATYTEERSNSTLHGAFTHNEELCGHVIAICPHLIPAEDHHVLGDHGVQDFAAELTGGIPDILECCKDVMRVWGARTCLYDHGALGVP